MSTETTATTTTTRARGKVPGLYKMGLGKGNFRKELTCSAAVDDGAATAASDSESDDDAAGGKTSDGQAQFPISPRTGSFLPPDIMARMAPEERGKLYAIAQDIARGLPPIGASVEVNVVATRSGCKATVEYSDKQLAVDAAVRVAEARGQYCDPAAAALTAAVTLPQISASNATASPLTALSAASASGASAAAAGSTADNYPDRTATYMSMNQFQADNAVRRGWDGGPDGPCVMNGDVLPRPMFTLLPLEEIRLKRPRDRFYHLLACWREGYFTDEHKALLLSTIEACDLGMQTMRDKEIFRGRKSAGSKKKKTSGSKSKSKSSKINKSDGRKRNSIDAELDFGDLDGDSDSEVPKKHARPSIEHRASAEDMDNAANSEVEAEASGTEHDASDASDAEDDGDAATSVVGDAEVELAV
jgi:hypothetical protein